MSNIAYHPWFHRLAVMTAGVALLPIVVGAVVTSVDAGMAFSDWPASDGYNMLAYPWLKSAGDQFVEHGHRLAGLLIGVFSLVLSFIFWKWEPRRWVRRMAFLVLLAVIAQGLLGGLRVVNDDPRLALVHGSFAACVFALMSAVALVTSRGWFLVGDDSSRFEVAHLKPLAVMLPLVVLAQYMLGGLLRHLGIGLFEHVGFASMVLLFVVMTAISAHLSRIQWLKRPTQLLLLLVLLQAGLGAGSWITKYGLASAGIVAVQYSTAQIVVQTSHTVVGMFIFMISAVYLFRVLRLDWLFNSKVRTGLQPGRISAAVSLSGGAG